MTVNDKTIYDSIKNSIKWRKNRIAEIKQEENPDKAMLEYHTYKLEVYEDVLGMLERNREFEINWINKELGREAIKVENNE